MGKKERVQKELDLLLEKLRFWRYVIFGIVSGVIGILFSLTQNKITMNYGVIALLLFSLIGIIISIKRITSLTKDYKIELDILEREE